MERHGGRQVWSNSRSRKSDTRDESKKEATPTANETPTIPGWDQRPRQTARALPKAGRAEPVRTRCRTRGAVRPLPDLEDRERPRLDALHTLKRAAQALRVSADFLLGLTNTPTPAAQLERQLSALRAQTRTEGTRADAPRAPTPGASAAHEPPAGGRAPGNRQPDAGRRPDPRGPQDRKRRHNAACSTSARSRRMTVDNRRRNSPALTSCSGSTASASGRRAPQVSPSSSSGRTGASRETGRRGVRRKRSTTTGSTPMYAATSSPAGREPAARESSDSTSATCASPSCTCTGMRIGQPISVTARFMAWRIHHAAYVEKRPCAGSKRSTQAEVHLYELLTRLLRRSRSLTGAANGVFWIEVDHFRSKWITSA